MHSGRGGVIYKEYTECYSISFLFLFFFHQSSLYPIKMFAKCFYLLAELKTMLGWPLSLWACLYRQLYLVNYDTERDK